MTIKSSKNLIIYDGLCVLCNGYIKFLLKRDFEDIFRLTPTSTITAKRILKKITTTSDTIYLIRNYLSTEPKYYVKSDAILIGISELGGIYKLFLILRAIPRPLRDAIYELNAKYRYRLFGQYEKCPIPSGEIKKRFIFD